MTFYFPIVHTPPHCTPGVGSEQVLEFNSVKSFHMHPAIAQLCIENYNTWHDK